MTDLPGPSAAGFTRAEEHMKAFGDDLLDEAGRVARRSSAESASADHVDEAAGKLYRGRVGRVRQFTGTVGGVITGVGGSAFVSFLVATEPSQAGLAVSFVMTVVGAGLVVGGSTAQ